MAAFHPSRLPLDFGRYRLTELLGEGGMAWVFGAHLIGPFGFRKPVAVKVVKAGVAGQSAQKMILNEAQLASRVMHPNVVDILDVGEVEGTTFFVMEWVSGVSVKRLLEEGRLPAPAALDLLEQVASGLAAIHDLRDPDGRSAAVVHRDLKPENVLVDTNGQARLVDFGIAVGEDQAEPDQIWGTPRYMSPEQAWGNPVVAASDVFGFGVLAYEVLFGENLLPSGGVGKVRRGLALLEDQLDDIAQLADALGRGFGDVLRGCLREEPQDRFRDGIQLFDALDRVRLPGRSDLADRVAALVGAPVEVEPPSHTTTRVLDDEAGWVEEHARAPLRVIRGGDGAFVEHAVAQHRRSGGQAFVVSLRDRSGLDALRAIARALGVAAGVTGRASIAEVLGARRALLVLTDADAAERDLSRWVRGWRLGENGAALLVTGVALDVAGAVTLDRGDADQRQEHRWSRLSRQAKRVVAACALFRDGFTLDDGVGVLQGAGFDEPWRYLARLGDEGFLGRDGDRLFVEGVWAERARSALSEGLRKRALAAHARHFAGWGDDAAFDGRIGPRALELHARWLADLSNLELALERADIADERAALIRVLLEVQALGHDVPGVDLDRAIGASPSWRLRVDTSLLRRQVQLGEPGAIETGERAVAEAERLREPALLAGACIELARACLNRVDYARSARAADRAVRVAEKHELRNLLVRAVRVQAVLQRRQGQTRRALNLLSWCAGLCRATSNRFYMTRIDALIGLCRMSLGELDLAEEALERSVTTLRTTTDVVALVTQLGNLALIQDRRGRLRAAASSGHEALRLAASHGVDDTHDLHRTLAGTALSLGELDTALKHAQIAVESGEARGARYQLAVSLHLAATIHRVRGRFEDSRRLEASARIAARETDELEVLSYCDYLAADRTLAEGDVPAARAQVDRLLRSAAFEGPFLRGVLLGLRCEVLLAEGHSGPALEDGDVAVRLLGGRNQLMWQLARVRRCRALVATRRLDEATALLTELDAYITREKLGPHALIRRTADRARRELRRARR